MTNILVGQMKPYQTFYLALNTLVEQTLQYAVQVHPDSEGCCTHMCLSYLIEKVPINYLVR